MIAAYLRVVYDVSQRGGMLTGTIPSHPFPNLLNRLHHSSFRALPAFLALLAFLPVDAAHGRAHSGHNRVYDVDDDDHDRMYTTEWPHVALDHDSWDMVRNHVLKCHQRMGLYRR